MRRAKRRNRQEEKPVGDISKYEKCDLCGQPEKAPVARMIRGRIRWICGDCWKELG